MKSRTRLVVVVSLLLVTFASAEVSEGEFEPPAGLDDGWYARIETPFGRIIARLLPEQAPQSVAHFAAAAEAELEWFDAITGELKKNHYYDGISVHRAEAGLRFEAGDPQGTGRGTPPIYAPREGLGPVNFNAPGRLGMTKGSGAISAVQFFATASAQPWLTGDHPCFGIIVEGREVVVRISQVKTYSNGRPIDPLLIEEIRIFSVGDPDPLPVPEPYVPRRHGLEARPEFTEK